MNPPYTSTHTDAHSRACYPDTGKLRELWSLCKTAFSGDIRMSQSA